MEILGENVRTFTMTTNTSVLFDVLVDPRFSCKTSRKVRGARHCARRTHRSRANSHASASSSSAKSTDDTTTKEMLKRELFDVFGIASSSSSSNDERNDDERNQRRQKQAKNGWQKVWIKRNSNRSSLGWSKRWLTRTRSSEPSCSAGDGNCFARIKKTWTWLNFST